MIDTSAPGSDEAAVLDGIRVVELGGGVAAGFCAHLLAGYGADVVQVGDAGLTPDEDRYLSRGKRRVEIDAGALHVLLENADVVIDGRSRSAPLDGPDAGEIRSAHPHVVVTVLTPFGLNGPHARHRATNIVSFASGGIMALTGERHLAPLQTGGDQALMLGGLHGFAATTVALLGALVQGEGDLIDISLQECAASMLEYCAAAWEYDSVLIERSGNMVRAEWGVYPAADGWAGVCCLGRQLPALFGVLGIEGEERFVDPVQRMLNNDELMAHVMVFMVERTKEELLAVGVANKLPIGGVRTPGELVEHRPLIERGFFDDAGPDGRLPGRPFPGLGWRSLSPATTVACDEVVAAWSHRDAPVSDREPERSAVAR